MFSGIEFTAPGIPRIWIFAGMLAMHVGAASHDIKISHPDVKENKLSLALPFTRN